MHSDPSLYRLLHFFKSRKKYFEFNNLLKLVLLENNLNLSNNLSMELCVHVRSFGNTTVWGEVGNSVQWSFFLSTWYQKIFPVKFNSKISKWQDYHKKMKNNLFQKHGNLFSLKTVFRIKTHFKKYIFEIYLTVFYLFSSDFLFFVYYNNNIKRDGTWTWKDNRKKNKTKKKVYM